MIRGLKRLSVMETQLIGYKFLCMCRPSHEGIRSGDVPTGDKQDHRVKCIARSRTLVEIKLWAGSGLGKNGLFIGGVQFLCIPYGTTDN